MKYFYQMRKESRAKAILYSVPVVLVVVCGVIYAAVHMVRSYQNYKEVSDEYKELKMREEEISARINTINDELALLESDEGRERVIRERFDIQKKGEEVVIFVKDDDGEVAEKRSILGSFGSFLKDLFGF